MDRNRKKNQNHVIEADSFHRVMYDIRRDASPVLSAATEGLSRAVRPAYEGNAAERAADDTQAMATEVFARLHDGDQIARTKAPTGAAWEVKSHRVLDNSDAFKELCASVAGDVDFAALALCGVMDQIAGKVGDMISSGEEDTPTGDGGEPGSDGESGEELSTWGVTPSDAMEAALTVACEDIRAELDETRQAMNGLAPGLGDAPGKGEPDPRRMLLAERLRNDDQLRDVLKKAGRLHRMHTRARKTKTDGHTEIVDVERGGDVGRLLPSVLVQLMDRDLEDHTMVQILERKALQYALAGMAPLGRGPIVAMRDISGSMRGQPHSWAAAVCILCVQVANKERRQVTIANYRSHVSGAYRMDTSGKAYVSSGGEWVGIGGMAELVLEIAGDQCSGGTRMGVAMDWVFENTDLMKDRADLIIVTDGRSDEVSANTIEKVIECKSQGLRISGLTINRGRLYRALSDVCDSVVDLDRSGDKARLAAGGVLV